MTQTTELSAANLRATSLAVGMLCRGLAIRWNSRPAHLGGATHRSYLRGGGPFGAFAASKVAPHG